MCAGTVYLSSGLVVDTQSLSISIFILSEYLHTHTHKYSAPTNRFACPIFPLLLRRKSKVMTESVDSAIFGSGGGGGGGKGMEMEMKGSSKHTVLRGTNIA